MKVLIVPLWNWNGQKEAKESSVKSVLIVPLWNWNYLNHSTKRWVGSFNRTFMELKSKWTPANSSSIYCFNRTFMELKLTLCFYYCYYLFCFNRTFMELKSHTITSPCRLTSSFNRTFMELKFEFPLYIHLRSFVLIVPLWNWNHAHMLRTCKGCSFNRTFMELKSCKEYAYNPRSFRFNRTFMELKFQARQFRMLQISVLIVPLWNWNINLLLWISQEGLSFNRTFMELKYLLWQNKPFEI